MNEGRSSLELQMAGYRLATAEILYHLPDHPGVLQSFIWQHYDMAPRFPELRKFLDFWIDRIEGRLHAVYVGRQALIAPPRYENAKGYWNLH
ncbi:MAG: Usg family protein [Geminicoccaceae bacterium]|nr:Usg family protein [Geminicoccaceae bacterium]